MDSRTFLVDMMLDAMGNSIARKFVDFSHAMEEFGISDTDALGMQVTLMTSCVAHWLRHTEEDAETFRRRLDALIKVELDRAVAYYDQTGKCGEADAESFGEPEGHA